MSAQPHSSEPAIYSTAPEGFIAETQVAAVYLEHERRFLLLQAGDHKQEPGSWGMPGGKMELGETSLEAAKRELFEETGVLIPEHEQYQWITLIYVCLPWINFTFHAYRVILPAAPQIFLSQEHKAFAWILPEEITHKQPLLTGGGLVLRHLISTIKQMSESAKVL